MHDSAPEETIPSLPLAAHFSVSPSWRATFHRWFVLYNPLYFFSALSVLAGVFLLGGALDESAIPWALGVIGLAAVTELYEILLLAAAAFLLHRGLRRPAILLALVAMVFLIDATFHTEAMAHAEPWDNAAILFWCGLAMIKLEAWRRVLRLELSRPSRALVAGGVLSLGLLPWLFDSGLFQATALLQAALWSFAAGFLIQRLWGSETRTRLALDEDGERALRRCELLFWTLLGLSLAVRLGLSVLAYGLEFEVIFLAPLAWLFLTGTVFSAAKSHGQTWLAAACLWLTLGSAELQMVVALSITAALTVLWRSKVTHRPELLTLALLWLLWPAWTEAAIPVAWKMLGAAIAFGLLAWRCRIFSALIASLASCLAATTLADLGEIGWGLLLLSAGFLTLLAGFVLSLRFRGAPENALKAEGRL